MGIYFGDWSSGPIRVMVRGGKYFLDRTLTFGLEDSGSREFPITCKAFGEEKPILSGGKRIANWKPYRGAIFQAELANGANGSSAVVPERKEADSSALSQI